MPRAVSSFSLLTLGCKVNQYDSQAVRELLESRGLVEVPFAAGADLAVVNTCAVTNEAVRKSRQAVRKARRLNPDCRVAVTGCHAAEDGESLRSFPGVAVVAPEPELPAALTGFLAGCEPTSEPPGDDAGPGEADADFPEPYEPEALRSIPLPLYSATQSPITRFDGHSRAFLKVQDGCDCYCSFCIIPFLRGAVRSKPVEAAVAETAALLAHGHREIVLTGVHLGAFGRAPGKRPPRRFGPGIPPRADPDDDAWHLNRSNRLADLIESLIDVDAPDGERWRLRLSSLEATEVTDRLVELLAGSDRICPHLHLPLQSGSSAVLRRMNRRYSADDFIRVCDAVRARVPDCAITADVIVGFPGETEAEFAETLETARRCGFSKIHVFPYSSRAGTAAAGYADPVDPKTKAERCRRLAESERRLADAYHTRFVGRQAEIVVEDDPSAAGPERRPPQHARTLRGLTEHYGEVEVRAGAGSVEPGRLLCVRLTEYRDGRFAAASA